MPKLYKGTIKKRASGSYGVWYYADDPQSGKRVQRAKYGFATRKAAEAYLTEIKAMQLRGLYVEMARIGFKTLCEKYLKEYAPLHIGELTLRSYRSNVTRLVRYFGDRDVATIGPDDVQGLVASLAASKSVRQRPFSPKSINNSLVLLHRIFEVAKKWRYLRDNPAANVEHLRVIRREMAFHSREEVGTLLQKAEGEAKVVLSLALLCGLRRGEIAGLRWEDIDLDRGQIRVRHALAKRTRKEAAAHDGERWLHKAPKSEAGRRNVDMVRAVRDVLELHRLSAPPQERNPLGLVFTRPGPDPKGPVMPWSPEHLVDANYIRVAKQVKVRILRFHDLRHTYTALRLHSGTTDIKYVQQQMGHSSIKMTMDTYGHLFQETQARESERLQREIEAILHDASARAETDRTALGI
jgi:integrase